MSFTWSQRSTPPYPGEPPRGPAGVSPPPPPPAVVPHSDAQMRLEALRLAVQAVSPEGARTGIVFTVAERYYKWIKTGEWE